MKRIISIVLLLLALLLAIQPAWAFHFCSGRLASVALLQSQKNACCAENDLSEQDNEVHIVGDRCCHTSLTVLLTDDFENPGGGSYSSAVHPMLLGYVKSLLTSLLTDNFTSPQTLDAPSEYLFTTGRQLLTRICVFII